MFLVLLSGCTIPEKLEITNNTDQLVVVKFKENSFRIAPKESAIVGEGLFMEFTIKLGKRRYSYSINPVSTFYISTEGWGPFIKRIFRVRVEADGRLWAIIPEKGGLPEAVQPAQPEGFPLEPKEV